MINVRTIIFCAFALGFAQFAFSQVQNDEQWFGVQLSQPVRDFDISYEQQIRTTYGLAYVDDYFNELGVRYKFNKYLRAKLNYRFSYKEPVVEPRIAHRFNLDVQLRYKIEDLRLEWRPRLQTRFNRSDERDGMETTWYERHKWTAEYKLSKRFYPYMGFEIFRPLNDPQSLHRIDQWRYYLGLNLDLKKRHAFDFFYIYQTNLDDVPRTITHMAAVQYSYTLKKIKKKKKKKKPSTPNRQ